MENNITKRGRRPRERGREGGRESAVSKGIQFDCQIVTYRKKSNKINSITSKLHQHPNNALKIYIQKKTRESRLYNLT